MSLLPEVIGLLCNLHDAQGRFTEFGRVHGILTRLDGRLRNLHPGNARSTIRRDDFRMVMDEYQDARVVTLLNRLRNLRAQFDRTARTPMRMPYNELDDAREAVEIATEDYGAGSPQESDAKENFARVWHDFTDQLAESSDEADRLATRMWNMRDRYRELAQLARRAETAYAELVDHPALVALGSAADDVRINLLAAQQALDEIASLASQITTSAATIRSRVADFRSQLMELQGNLAGRYRDFIRRYRLGL
jgi:chromosome segregation ATPase